MTRLGYLSCAHAPLMPSTSNATNAVANCFTSCFLPDLFRERETSFVDDLSELRHVRFHLARELVRRAGAGLVAKRKNCRAHFVGLKRTYERFAQSLHHRVRRSFRREETVPAV